MASLDVNSETISRLIIQSLSKIRIVTVESISDAMSADGGNLDITHKEHAAVIAILEQELGCGLLLQPKDLGKDKKQANSCLSPIKGTSIAELRDHVASKLAAQA